MKKRIKTGLEYRKRKGLFISKAIEYTNTTAIEKLFTLLGVPLLIDKNDELFADVALFPLLAPIAIFNSLFSESERERCCFLYNFCKKQSVPIYNEMYCSTTPWKQVNGENLCPYAIYIYRYGLNPDLFKFH